MRWGGVMETVELKNNKVSVIRKDIKHMYLKIKRVSGEVQVIAPRDLEKETITAFVEEKEPWIRTHTIHAQNVKRIIDQSIKEGVEIPFFGDYVKIEYRYVKTNPLYFQLVEDKLILYIKIDSKKEKVEDLVKECYRDELMKKIDKYMNKWLEKTGLEINSVKTKKMKTRWGTCNINKKNIWINLELAKIDEKYLEYVIVHELMHLFEKGHGKKFKEKMTEYYPGWESIEKDIERYAIG